MPRSVEYGAGSFLTYSRTLTEYGSGVKLELTASRDSPAAAAVDESRPVRHRRSHARMDAPARRRVRLQFSEAAATVRWRSGIPSGQLGRARSRDRRRIRGIRRSPHHCRAAGTSWRAGTRRATPPRVSPILATVVIATGQQAGVFGGPLFTLLKAVTAIQLAARGVGRARRSGRARCSGSMPKIMTGKRSAAAPCSTRSFKPKTITLADSGRRRRAADRAADARRARGAAIDDLLAAAAATDFTAQCE